MSLTSSKPSDYDWWWNFGGDNLLIKTMRIMITFVQLEMEDVVDVLHDAFWQWNGNDEDWGYSPWLTCGRSKVDQILKLPVQWQTNSMDINGIHGRPSGVAKRGRSRSNSPEQVSNFWQAHVRCQLFRLAMWHSFISTWEVLILALSIFIAMSGCICWYPLATGVILNDMIFRDHNIQYTPCSRECTYQYCP